MLVIKADILALMHEKQKLISEAMSPRDYVLACVEVMFEVAAEVLATTKTMKTTTKLMK